MLLVAKGNLSLVPQVSLWIKFGLSLRVDRKQYSVLGWWNFNGSRMHDSRVYKGYCKTYKVQLFKERTKRKLAEVNVPRTHAISTNRRIQLFKEKYITNAECTSSEKLVYEYKSVNMYMVWVYYLIVFNTDHWDVLL